MAQSIINIAVYGQVKNAGGADDTRLVLTYPDPRAAATGASWLNGLFDPRDARLLTNDNDVYTVWTGPEGNYYGIIVPANDGRNGRLMLCLHTGHRVSTSGAVVLRTLRALRAQLAQSNNVAAIEPHLNALAATLIPQAASTAAGSPVKGIRVYNNEAELEKIFTFPRQAAHDAYRCVYIAPAGAVIPQSQSFAQITAPVTVTFRIYRQLPAGVTVDKTAVAAGRTLRLTYSKDGCVPVTKAVTIDGRPTPEVGYNDYELIINDPATAAVRFQRKVRLHFEDSTGSGMVRDVTIQVANQPGTIAVELTVPDTDRFAPFSFKAIKTGYRSQDVTITEADVRAGAKTVRLEPLSNRVKVNIILPNQAVSTVTVDVRDNDPLLSYLQRHGNVLHVGGEQATAQHAGSKRKQRRPAWARIIPLAAIALATLLLVGYGGYSIVSFIGGDTPWPFGGEAKSDTLQHAPNVDEEVNPNNQAGDNLDLNKDDINYLKNNDLWDKKQLKSDGYKALIDLIAGGLAENAFNHKYNECGNVNGYWSNPDKGTGCVELYREMQDRVDPQKIQDEMRRCSKGDVVDIRQLNNSLIALKRQLEKNERFAPPAPRVDDTHGDGVNRQRPDRQAHEQAGVQPADGKKSVDQTSGSAGASSGNTRPQKPQQPANKTTTVKKTRPTGGSD